MGLERDLHPAVISVGVAVASGAAPALLGFARALFATSEGEGFAIAFATMISAPASTLAGLISAILVFNVSGRSARPLSAWRVWLLTTAGTCGGMVVGFARLARSLGSTGFSPIDAWALAPLLAAAGIGGLPPTLLALRLRSTEASEGDPAARP